MIDGAAVCAPRTARRENKWTNYVKVFHTVSPFRDKSTRKQGVYGVSIGGQIAK